MPTPLPLEQLQGLAERERTFILLDTAQPADKNRHSYVFIRPVHVIRADSFGEINAALESIDRYAEKYWLAGYVAYEAGYAMEDRLRHYVRGKAKLPLAWFGVFEEPYIFDHKKGIWNRRCPLIPAFGTPLDDHPSGGANFCSLLPDEGGRGLTGRKGLRIRAGLNGAEYTRKIRAIKAAIARGDTYQVNFTFDLTGRSPLTPFELYRKIRKNQPTPYCAYLQWDGNHVLSFSPELFFQKRGSGILVKPMKGTAPRAVLYGEDRRRAAALAAGPKNRAENLMIVDLLRNDLGKVCRNGSVKVRSLFDIETHPTIHQMTSTVTGTLRPGTRHAEIIRSLFPSGSVTGAPKIRTMQIIRALERGERGVYCGMLGFVSPRGKAIFNVPIRTLQTGRGERRWRYRVGSGIVWDSKSVLEYRECLEKARLLDVACPSSFEIVESILWNGKPLYLRDHLARLKSSARYFGYPFSDAALVRLAADISRKMGEKRNAKVRIFLGSGGSLRWDDTPLGENAASPVALLSGTSVDESDPFLYHKTTHREHYREAAERLRRGECFDVLFTNRRGELSEGAISNIFVRQRGKLFTPPVRCGLLPGILRKRLLAAGICREKVLYPEDLKSAEAVYCGNSVRGLVQVRVEDTKRKQPSA